MEQYLGINVDYSRDSLFDELGIRRLKESYMLPGESSPQQRFAFVAKQFGSNQEHSQRLYDYASKHWLSFSTPILSHGRTKRSLGLSCYLSYIHDSAEGLIDALAEINWLSMLGGGIGIGFGIRSSDEKSTGVMAHMKIYDASSLAYRQGSTRRGSYAAYLDIGHPDIKQFIQIRKPTGDPNVRCMNMHHGVNIPDSFMRIIANCMVDPNANDDWPLIDPHSKVTHDVVSAKALWEELITLRLETGEPYFHFIDASNRAMPQWLKDLGLTITQSNLCTETILPSSRERTAVCCLSSVNLVYWDLFKYDYQFFLDVAEMLDNVLQYFIENAPSCISRAVFSAIQERSIGVGTLGFHSYLQARMTPIESVAAKSVNKSIFKLIKDQLTKASLELGELRGEAPDAIGTGLRFSHLTAIAPNATSSILMGNTSPSIEPFRANAYRQDTMSGAFFTKSKILDSILVDRLGVDTDEYHEAWSSVISNSGSVAALECLTGLEKDVFKTAIEIDQRWLVDLAADRQKYIDQGQSLNLFFRPDCDVRYMHAVHFEAWSKGLKTLYYCRSESVGSADKVSRKVERNKIEELDMSKIAIGEGCVACE